MVVYKYVSPERIDIIKNSRIRLTPVFSSSLNDPFECRFIINPRHEELDKAIQDNFEAEIAEAYVRAKYLYYDFGVLCLTRNNINLLMWSHYARNHTGVVIGFDENSSLFNKQVVFSNLTYGTREPINRPGFGSIRKVEYSEIMPTVVYIGDAFDVLFKKSHAWSYEEEERMIINLSETELIDGMNFLEIPNDTIKEVIIGANASNSMKEEIINLKNKNIHNDINIFQSKLHGRSYKLEIQNVS